MVRVRALQCSRMKMENQKKSSKYNGCLLDPCPIFTLCSVQSIQSFCVILLTIGTDNMTLEAAVKKKKGIHVTFNGYQDRV